MMEREAFEKLVVEGYERIPKQFRDKIQNVGLLVEDEPSSETRAENGLEEGETLLGLYHGIPLAERGDFYGMGATMPDTVTLYQRPIEEEAEGDPERIREVVCDTVWHEIAHHFGMDEPEVRRREEERERGSDKAL